VSGIQHLLDLLTHTPKRGKTDRESFIAFQETLAGLTRLAGSSTHPRLTQVQKRLDAVSVCLYAAFTDSDLAEVCEMAGLKPRSVSRIANELEIPRRAKELAHAYQALFLTGLFHKDLGGMFSAFQSLSRAIEKGSERAEKELEKGDIGQAVKLLERLTRLSMPLMFLYRDHMSPNLDRKIKKWMGKEWTRRAVQELTDPGVENS